MVQLAKRIAKRMKRAVDRVTARRAGGIVFRVKRGQLEVLLVTARRNKRRWVLPKGGVKRGETPQQAAVREVREESGARGKVIGAAGSVRYANRNGLTRADYFLIRFRDFAHDAGEQRRVAWFAVEDAMRELRYASARRILLEAYPLLAKQLRRSSS